LKNSTESSKNQINAELKLIKANLKRATQLFQMGGISRQAFDEVNFKYQAKLAQLDSLNSKVKVVQSDLNKTSIYAPFAGTISERQVDVGSIVNPGEPVVSIFKTDQPEIRVGIPPDKKSQFRKGMSFDFEYNEQLFKATFDSFLPNLTNDNRTLTGIFKARTLKDFSEGDLVYLKYEKANNLAVFVVPEECLTQGVRGLWSILRLRATNPDKNNKTTIKQKKLATRLLKADSSNAIHTIESVPVELIHLKQNLAFIKGGLKENDLIVRHGVHKLVPQQKVNIAKISEGVFGNL
jgi:RND family efflux transporter MFP subunit